MMSEETKKLEHTSVLMPNDEKESLIGHLSRKLKWYIATYNIFQDTSNFNCKVENSYMV